MGAADIAVVAVADHRRVRRRPPERPAGVGEEKRVGLDHADFVGEEDRVEVFADPQQRDLLAMGLRETVRDDAELHAALAQALATARPRRETA